MNDVKILDKVRKLLLLTQSANEHEAATAMAHAQRLAVRHGIDLSQVDTEETEVLEPIDSEVIFKSGKRSAWRTSIAQSAASAFLCHMHNSYAGDWVRTKRAWRKQYRTIVITGSSTNRTIAVSMIHYLWKTGERLADEALQAYTSWGRSDARNYRQSFLLGYKDRICSRLREETRQIRRKGIVTPAPSESATALAVCALFDREEKRREQFFEFQGIEFRPSAGFSGRIHSHAAYSAGQDAGNDVSLHRQVGSEITKELTP